jgi:hypothetical protein
VSSLGSAKLDAWRAIVAAPKNLFYWPFWSEGPMYRESRRQAVEAGRLPLVSNIASRSEMLINVSDNNDIALEDVRLRIAVWNNRPMEDVTSTFEIYDSVRWVCVSRIDLNPATPHPNRYWRRFGLPPEINGSHIHGCEDNVRIGPDAFLATGNLPNARALDREPQSFKEICVMVGEHFNVSGLQDLTAPDWNRSLL